MGSRKKYGIAVLVVCVAAGIAFWLMAHVENRLHASRDDDGTLHLWIVGSGPIIVTHLESPNKDSAVLPAPLLIVDSAGRRISHDQLTRLSWVDYVGRPTEPPSSGSPMSAIYYWAKGTSFGETKAR